VGEDAIDPRLPNVLSQSHHSLPMTQSSSWS
jgi:hypothetical protein